MRLGRLTALGLLLLAMCRAPARAAPEGGDGTPGKPLLTATRQNAYTIPFRIEPPKPPAEQPVEVQLHVSTNQGATWELSSKVKPDKGSFVFRAPHDGEYWYSIRTMDAKGTLRPEGALEAQLKVIVDTVAPRLDLTAARGEAGEIIARWKAVDPYLKAGSFNLEYQPSPGAAWEKVAVESAPEAMRHTLSGEATWWPRQGTGSILVRAEIADHAGNKGSTQAVVKMKGQPDAGAAPGDTAQTTPTDDWRAGRDPARWPADRSSAGPLSRPGANANYDNAATRDPTRTSTPGATSNPQLVPAQPVGQNYRANRPADEAPLGLGAGQRPHRVNTRSFELEYEIDAVGSSGIAKVELWGTRDGGRTWSSFGVDSDNRSPLDVNVDAEGTYGFRVVVQSGNGLGGKPPAPGDPSDVWIAVDLTKPVAKIIAAEIIAETGELAIRWEAQDEAPDARPISLLFSTTAQGPWTPLASGLENSGSYRWRLDDRVPDRIYLRLEMRDEAGNVGVFETPDTIALDRHRPEGRIRAVRPLAK